MGIYYCMKKVLKLTESNLIKLIKNIIKEQREQDTLLKNVYYQAHAIPKLRPFRGKKLVIDGSLDFKPFKDEVHLTDLGPIKVLGNIDISYTKIKSLDDGWTLVTKDGSLAGLHEHTVAITKEGPLVLTR